MKKKTVKNLIPNIGSEDVTFGQSEEEIVKVFGEPVNSHTIDDVKHYPPGRKSLNYMSFGFLVAPSKGVISITMEAELGDILLWGEKVNDYSIDELRVFIESKGYDDSLISKHYGWEDQDLVSVKAGILASYSEDKLLCLEIVMPGWKELKE